MINIYYKKLNGIWYGAVIKKNKVLATYFSLKNQI